MNGPLPDTAGSKAAFLEFVQQLAEGQDPNPSSFAEAYGLSTVADLHEVLEEYRSIKEVLGEGSASMASKTAMPAAGSVLGEYQLVKMLGRGGMGEVWEAKDTVLKRSVALKILPPGFLASEMRLARFHREARSGGLLSHSNIVSVYGVGEADGIHYIIQELVPHGRTLEEELSELQAQKALPDGYDLKIVRMFVNLAKALQAAHEKGVIHRDVKPSNILLTAENAPKLGDFGLAWLSDDPRISLTGDLAGTPHYMSPEQIDRRSELVDPRTDVFSLGATFYEALTFTRPFDAPSSVRVFERIRKEDPEGLRSIRPSISKDLEIVCLKALEKRLENRYLDMAAFAEDLQRILDHRPILARSPSLADQIWKWTYRHPVAATISASLGIAALLFGILYGELLKTHGELQTVNQANLGLIADLSTANKAVNEEATKAKEAQEQAEGDARTAKRCQKFMVDLFMEANVVHGSGANLTAGQLAEQGMAMLTQLEDEPYVQASFAQSLAYVALSIEQKKEASELMTLAWNAIQKIKGPEDIEYYSFQVNYADMLRATHDYKGAVKHYEQAIEGLERTASSKHQMHLIARNNLVSLYSVLRRFEDALQLQKEVVADAEEVYGKGSTQTIRMKMLLANCHNRVGQREEAYDQLTSLLKFSMEALEPDHSLVQAVRRSLARVCLYLGKYEQAEEGYRANYEVQMRLYGADRLQTQSTALDIVGVYRLQRKWQDVEKAVIPIKDWYAEHAPESEHRYRIRDYLAEAYIRQEKFAEAVEPLKANVELARKISAPSHPSRRLTQELLGKALLSLNQKEEFDSVWKAYREDLLAVEEIHVNTYSAFEKMSQLYEQFGHTEEALAVAEDILRQLPENHDSRKQAQDFYENMQSRIGMSDSDQEGNLP